MMSIVQAFIEIAQRMGPKTEDLNEVILDNAQESLLTLSAVVTVKFTTDDDDQKATP